MKKSVPHLFADMTAALEDMHGVAVEGQRADLSPDMQKVICQSLRTGIASLGVIERVISIRLTAGPHDN